jgi:hypothetical protein
MGTSSACQCMCKTFSLASSANAGPAAALAASYCVDVEQWFNRQHVGRWGAGLMALMLWLNLVCDDDDDDESACWRAPQTRALSVLLLCT